MRKISIISILLVYIPLAASTYDNAERGRVDWIKGQLTARGYDSVAVTAAGRPYDADSGSEISISKARSIAYSRSREKAIRNAAGLLKNIRIDQDNYFGDILKENPAVMQNISSILRNKARYKLLPSDYLNTQCILTLKNGTILEAINYPFPEMNFPVSDKRETGTLYTSLIIDTRGLGVKPMLLPRILNEQGLEIYGSSFIAVKEAVRHQAVSYVYNEDSAAKHRKAGEKPYFCTALKSVKGCPVISDEDAEKVYSHDRNLAYLKKCRVIFIIDRQTR